MIKNLEEEVKRLKEQIHRLELEKDILEKTTDLIKKDPGINPENLTNKEKTMVIGALKDKYKLKELLTFINLKKSSYFYQKTQLSKGDKYSKLRDTIKDIFNKNYKCYGYRRIYNALVIQEIIVSEKIIRRIMKEERLNMYQPKQKRYSSYMA